MSRLHKSQQTGGWFRTALAYACAAALFVFYGNLVTSSSVYDEDHALVKIERINPAIVSAIAWGALAAALVLLVVSSVSFKLRVVRWPVLGLLLGCVLYPYSVIKHTFNNLASWTVHGHVITDDGAEYVFCDSSFLQGQIMAIGEVTGADLFKTSYRVLVDNNGDSPRSWSSLIRPINSSDKYGQLYLCNESFLVGVRYRNHCYLAYDLKSDTAFGHGDVEALYLFSGLMAQPVGPGSSRLT